MAADIDKQPFSDNDEKDLSVNAADSAGDEELEEYGVWVKVGPQDVDNAVGDDDLAIEDFPAGDIDEESLLTEEEEALLGDLEGGSGEVSVEGFDVASEIALDEDETPSFDLDEDLSDISESDFASLETDELGDDLDSLDELDDLSLDAEEDTGTEETVEDISLDAGESDIDELSDLSDLDSSTDAMPGADDELNNIDIDDLEQDSSGEDLVELVVEDEVAPEMPSPIDAPIDDIASLEMDLQDDEVSLVGEPVDSSDQSEILIKIESELREIKNELASLKQELSSLRGVAVAPAPSPDEQVDEEASPSGFFEEEEDETIALTGDELDNILSTADFTEETVAESEVPDDQDVVADIEPPIAEVVAEVEAETLEAEPLEVESIETEPLEADSIEVEPLEAESLDVDPFEDEPFDVESLEAELVEDEAPVELMPDSPEDDFEDLDFNMDSDESSIEALMGDSDEKPAVETVADLSLEGELSEDIGLDSVDMMEEAPVEDLEEIPEAFDDLGELDELSPESDSLMDQEDLIPLEDDDLEEIDLSESFQDANDIDGSIDEILAPIDEDLSVPLDDLSTLDEVIEEDAFDLQEPDTVPAEAVDDDGVDALELESLEGDDLDIGELSDEGIDDLETLGDDDLELDDMAADVSLDDIGVEELELTELDEGLEEASEGLEMLDGDDLELEELSEDTSSVEEDMDELELDIDMDAEPVIEPEVEELTLGSLEDDGISEIEEVAAFDGDEDIPDDLREELRSVLQYMDHLLESLPEDKIQEFAQSEHFEVYRKLFEELGLES